MLLLRLTTPHTFKIKFFSPYSTTSPLPQPLPEHSNLVAAATTNRVLLLYQNFGRLQSPQFCFMKISGGSNRPDFRKLLCWHLGRLQSPQHPPLIILGSRAASTSAKSKGLKEDFLARFHGSQRHPPPKPTASRPLNQLLLALLLPPTHPPKEAGDSRRTLGAGRTAGPLLASQQAPPATAGQPGGPPQPTNEKRVPLQHTSSGAQSCNQSSSSSK